MGTTSTSGSRWIPAQPAKPSPQITFTAAPERGRNTPDTRRKYAHSSTSDTTVVAAKMSRISVENAYAQPKSTGCPLT